MKTIWCLVLMAFLSIGICTAQVPDLVGNWTGSQNAYVAGDAAYKLSENESVSLAIVEQKDRLFTGNLTYLLNGKVIVEGFAGAIGLDNKTLYIAEFNEGYDFGAIISRDEIELIYLADGGMGRVVIEELHRISTGTVPISQNMVNMTQAIMMLPALSWGIGSFQDITPDEVIAENVTIVNESVVESDPVYWYNKGKELLNASKYNESIEAYDRAIELNQSYAEAWNHKGSALFSLGKYNDSIEACERSIALNPNFSRPWSNKGEALRKLGKYDKAIKCYDEAIRLDPNFARAWRNKGVALAAQGKYDEAIKAHDNAIEIDPQDADAWYNKGNVLFDQGKYYEAIKSYDEFIKIDPQDAKAWINKAPAIANLGNHYGAIKAIDKAIEVDPKNAAAWYTKGNIFKLLGRTEEADAAFAKAKKLGYTVE
jgi:tetratricopeptide (TPR) repeat protein